MIDPQIEEQLNCLIGTHAVRIPASSAANPKQSIRTTQPSSSTKRREYQSLAHVKGGLDSCATDFRHSARRFQRTIDAQSTLNNLLDLYHSNTISKNEFLKGKERAMRAFQRDRRQKDGSPNKGGDVLINENIRKNQSNISSNESSPHAVDVDAEGEPGSTAKNARDKTTLSDTINLGQVCMREVFTQTSPEQAQHGEIRTDGQESCVPKTLFRTADTQCWKDSSRSCMKCDEFSDTVDAVSLRREKSHLPKRCDEPFETFAAVSHRREKGQLSERPASPTKDGQLTSDCFVKACQESQECAASHIQREPQSGIEADTSHLVTDEGHFVTARRISQKSQASNAYEVPNSTGDDARGVAGCWNSPGHDSDIWQKPKTPLCTSRARRRRKRRKILIAANEAYIRINKFPCDVSNKMCEVMPPYSGTSDDESAEEQEPESELSLFESHFRRNDKTYLPHGQNDFHHESDVSAKGTVRNRKRRRRANRTEAWWKSDGWHDAEWFSGSVENDSQSCWQPCSEWSETHCESNWDKQGSWWNEWYSVENDGQSCWQPWSDWSETHCESNWDKQGSWWNEWYETGLAEDAVRETEEETGLIEDAAGETEEDTECISGELSTSPLRRMRRPHEDMEVDRLMPLVGSNMVNEPETEIFKQTADNDQCTGSENPIPSGVNFGSEPQFAPADRNEVTKLFENCPQTGAGFTDQFESARSIADVAAVQDDPEIDEFIREIFSSDVKGCNLLDEWICVPKFGYIPRGWVVVKEKVDASQGEQECCTLSSGDGKFQNIRTVKEAVILDAWEKKYDAAAALRSLKAAKRKERSKMFVAQSRGCHRDSDFEARHSQQLKTSNQMVQSELICSEHVKQLKLLKESRDRNEKENKAIKQFLPHGWNVLVSLYGDWWAFEEFRFIGPSGKLANSLRDAIIVDALDRGVDNRSELDAYDASGFGEKLRRRHSKPELNPLERVVGHRTAIVENGENQPAKKIDPVGRRGAKSGLMRGQRGISKVKWSLVGLPPGWTVKEFPQRSGKMKGRTRTFFVSPGGLQTVSSVKGAVLAHAIEQGADANEAIRKYRQKVVDARSECTKNIDLDRLLPPGWTVQQKAGSKKKFYRSADGQHDNVSGRMNVIILDAFSRGLDVQKEQTKFYESAYLINSATGKRPMKPAPSKNECSMTAVALVARNMRKHFGSLSQEQRCQCFDMHYTTLQKAVDALPDNPKCHVMPLLEGMELNSRTKAKRAKFIASAVPKILNIVVPEEVARMAKKVWTQNCEQDGKHSKESENDVQSERDFVGLTGENGSGAVISDQKVVNVPVLDSGEKAGHSLWTQEDEEMMRNLFESEACAVEVSHSTADQTPHCDPELAKQQHEESVQDLFEPE